MHTRRWHPMQSTATDNAINYIYAVVYHPQMKILKCMRRSLTDDVIMTEEVASVSIHVTGAVRLAAELPAARHRPDKGTELVRVQRGLQVK